jgi:hypothetical protein
MAILALEDGTTFHGESVGRMARFAPKSFSTPRSPAIKKSSPTHRIAGR